MRALATLMPMETLVSAKAGTVERDPGGNRADDGRRAPGKRVSNAYVLWHSELRLEFTLQACIVN